ncbi:hypothetical protein KRR40_12580 [Niabella defluvii]|nr:hypothetical protein KRR40_12580 [Niabella sp. I65]
MSYESKLRAAIKGLPLVLANEAVNFTLENFRKQGFQGGSGLQAWAKRKRNKKMLAGLS